MRQYISKGILLAGMVVAMTGCDENAWNDKLEGFEGSPEITDVKTVEYTLTDADYASIASNTTNVGLAGDNVSALKAVGTQHYFTESIPASKYVPAFLASTSFPYFTLSDGSAIKLTYNVGVGIPAEVSALAAAPEYVVSVEDYEQAWDNGENYIEAFAPSVTAAKNLPGILAANFPEAVAGDYVVVNYDYTDQEPIFSAVGDEPTPGFVCSDVIGTTTVGSNVTINGIVTGTCASGLIVTDLTGSIFIYFKDTTDLPSYKLGDQLVINGAVSAYNKGLQIAAADAEIETKGSQAVSYPEPKILSGADFVAIAARETDEAAIYAQFTGVVKVDGNYINFIIEGAENVQGSPYGATDEIKAQLTDGSTMTVTGYLMSISGKGKYCNFVITALSNANKAPVAPVPTTNANTVYTYNGSKWTEVKNVAILQPSDYTAMGQSYGNLSNNLPAELLPIYLKNKYPYAQADDTKYVMYKYYASGAGTSYRCDQYIYDGTEWAINKGIETETAQFVRSHGIWNYDPSVTITLPAGKGQDMSTTYYQACVDWVYEHVDKPLGSTSIKSGLYYVTSYGNNEYYSGTSAYQGNVDVRASAAKTQYPTGYEGMSDDFIVELMKQRFAYQVMPGALATLHADAVPVDGIDVLYTINFAIYNGSTAEYTVVYKVTAPATFEMVSCTMWEGGQPTEKIDLQKYMK